MPLNQIIESGQKAGPPAALPDLLESAFASLPSAVVVFDRRLSVLFQNQLARDLLSIDGDLASALSAIAVESAYKDWSAELRKVVETDCNRQMDLTVRTGKDQPESFLSLTIIPLRANVTGQIVGGILIAEDVTHRISMERRLAVSERLAAVGSLAARVAHELNNPLDGILRFTNLALRRIGESGASSVDPKITEYLEHIRGGILRMRDIVSSLLEFSRSTPDTMEQATINRIVEDAVSALEAGAQESKVAVVCNFLQTDMPIVRGSSLFQVFCNLLKNAIDAMPNGGAVTIATQIIGPDVVVSFEDTGVGLPEDIEKIFEPFFTTKAPGKGTGLGLAVCRELIEKYSGTIIAKRRQPKGAAFIVSIPIRNCAAAPLVRGRTRGTGGTGAVATVSPVVAPPRKA